jgi:hypothetical protein
MKLGGGLVVVWEAIHFFLHFTDSELNAKMKEQINLYARQNIGKLGAQSNFSPSF